MSLPDLNALSLPDFFEHLAQSGEMQRLIDLAFFVAEHDDHHLAQITRLKRTVGAS